MTKEQLEIIVGLFAGVQTALVHLVNTLDSKGVLARGEIAASFRDTANAVPAEVRNREQVVLVLNQLARGIESSNYGPELVAEIKRLLH